MARSTLRSRPSLVVSACFLLGAIGRGDEPPSRAAPEPPKPSATASDDTTAPPPTKADVEALRAATTEQLKAFRPSAMHEAAGSTRSGTAGPDGAAPPTEGSVPATAGASVKPPLRGLLEERLHLLNEYDTISQSLERATHPDPSPEQQAAEARTELRELEAALSRAAEDPETLLPALFRGPSVSASRTLPSEMKAALESIASELKEWRIKVETLKGEIANRDSKQNAKLAERDKLFQGLATLKVKKEEFDSAVTDALSVEARRLARERLVNFEWRTRVQSLRLRDVEAQLALETRLADVRTLQVQIGRLHVQIGLKTREQMQARYRDVALVREHILKQEAAKEEEKAQRPGNDPLERYRAGRTAELLKLEASVLKFEQAQAATPSPSYDEQKALADHADEDFLRIKNLLQDGSVSRLDAIRLNYEFRRIGPERDRLIKDELAKVEAQVQFHENALTSVEIELLRESLHEFESDQIRELLPKSRWQEGERVLDALEKRRYRLLVRQRDALDSLTTSGGHTLAQVVRRLEILDKEYGFIRTHIFWLRDQEPIGPQTLGQEVRESRYLVKALLRLARESLDPKRWRQPSAEFLVATLAALALPLGLLRLRRGIRALAEHELPRPQV